MNTTHVNVKKRPFHNVCEFLKAIQEILRMKIWESQCAVSKKYLVKCFNVNKYDSDTDKLKVSPNDALIAKQQSHCHKCLSWTITSNNQHDWTPLKYVNVLQMIVSIWRNLRRLSAGGKSTSYFRFSLRCCKDIGNLLFWILWACLVTHAQNDSINF